MGGPSGRAPAGAGDARTGADGPPEDEGRGAGTRAGGGGEPAGGAVSPCPARASVRAASTGLAAEGGGAGDTVGRGSRGGRGIRARSLCAVGEESRVSARSRACWSYTGRWRRGRRGAVIRQR